MLSAEVSFCSLDVLEPCHRILPRTADAACDKVSLLILRGDICLPETRRTEHLICAD